MAGLPQIGDIIKFCELGWKVYEYGWGQAANASKLPHFPVSV